MRYYLIAGEASGDMHGAALIRSIKQFDPAAELRFHGGEKMLEAAGGGLFRDYRETAVMGITEVALKMRRILRNISLVRQDILAWKPDLLILIDYPGFNMRMARFAHRHGIRVCYYIAPKVWARAEGRVRQMRRDIDMLYVIFPFEQDYFRRHGIEARYFGNPLAEKIHAQEGPREKMVALLPGSRKAELKWMLPRFAAIERMMHLDDPASPWHGWRLVIPAAPNVTPEEIRSRLPQESRIEILTGCTYDVLSRASSALINSGTASFEAALFRTPQVVSYGVNFITWIYGRLAIRVKYISLANIILDRRIFPELIQGAATPQRLLSALEFATFDEATRSGMLAGYDELRGMLTRQGEGSVTDQIAADMIQYFRK